MIGGFCVSEDPAIDFLFHRRRPSPPLDRFVASLWYARGRIDHGSERILPTGSAVLLINLGSPFRTRTCLDPCLSLNTESWLTGPQTGYLVSAPTAETHMMGAVFHPWGAYPFFRTRLDGLADRTVETAALWPAAVVARLRDRLASTPRLADRFAILQSALAERLDGWENGLGLARHALTRLAAPGACQPGALAAELGISRKHLVEIVRRVAGLTPGRFQRIARMNRLLQAVDPAGPVRWDRLAHAAEYYDQAHFNRDFRAFAGVTPSEYLAQRRAHYGTQSSPDTAHFIPFQGTAGENR